MLRSLGTLVWIVVCRHKLLAACALAALWWWRPSASSPTSPASPQAAVFAGGFAAIDSANHVVVLDRDGERRHALTVRGVANPRLVGVSFGSGLGVVWRDGKKVAVAGVDGEGNVTKPTQFGKHAQLMCKGTASNAHRFAVGWTEADGGVWIVFGPTTRAGQDLEAHAVADGAVPGDAPARPTFCAVASAADKTGLLWGDGNKVSFALCGKNCPSLPMQLGLAKGRELLGFGCIQDACMIASRKDGTLDATWVTAKGKVGWTQPLRDASPDTQVELVGTGTQIAIAYATAGEPVIVTASPSGALTPIWQGAADGVPSIQWADGRLAIARHVDGALVGSVERVP